MYIHVKCVCLDVIATNIMQGINVDIVLNMHVQLNVCVCVCECLCACVAAGGSLHVVTGVTMRLYVACHRLCSSQVAGRVPSLRAHGPVAFVPPW